MTKVTSRREIVVVSLIFLAIGLCIAYLWFPVVGFMVTWDIGAPRPEWARAIASSLMSKLATRIFAFGLTAFVATIPLTSFAFLVLGLMSRGVQVIDGRTIWLGLPRVTAYFDKLAEAASEKKRKEAAKEAAAVARKEAKRAAARAEAEARASAESDMAMSGQIPSNMFAAYAEHKFGNFGQAVQRVFFALFRPGALLGIIQLGDRDSFRHALNDALISTTAYAALTPLTAVLIGATHHKNPIAEFAGAFAAVGGALFLFALIFFVARRATSLSTRSYSDYLHGCCYFITAHNIVSILSQAIVVLITLAFHGPAANWPVSLTDANCKIDAKDIECLTSFGADSMIGGLGNVFTLTASLQDIWYAASFAVLTVSLIAAFVTHIAILKRALQIPAYYSVGFYLVFFPAYIYLVSMYLA